MEPERIGGGCGRRTGVEVMRTSLEASPRTKVARYWSQLICPPAIQIG